MEREIVIILAYAICILGPSLVLASAGHASIGALGRNPSAAPKIFTAMIILLIFGATISIIGMLVLSQLYGS